MKKLSFIILSLVIGFSETKLMQAKKLDSQTYRAGVVEFQPATGTLQEITTKNLENYLSIINDASKMSLDILVFPEATLNRDWEGTTSKDGAIIVPSEKEQVTPCGQGNKFSYILDQISCAAQSENMYIVINVAELAYCNDSMNPNCTDKDIYMFNTNVVFDRQGMIISRYRKIHLFGETGFSESFGKELGIFETDFDVKFGHFICFDLMFQQPAVQLVEKEQITNVIFPTMWYSELPALTAVEIQEGWAYTHNVNLLAAGANNPNVGSTGSGIYSGRRGAITSIMSGLPTTKILTADVPKIPGSLSTKSSLDTLEKVRETKDMDHLYLKAHDMKIYSSQLINDTKNVQNIELTFGRAKCTFRISINTDFIPNNTNGKDHYTYRAIVFDGVRSFRYKNGGVIECAIIACTTEYLSSCGERFKDYADLKPVMEISSIEIDAIVPKPTINATTEAHNIVYHPVSLLTNIYPLKANEFKYSMSDSENANMIKLEMKMNVPQSELLTFGFFARDFASDHLPITNGTNATFKINFFATILGLVIIGMITNYYAYNH